MCGCLYSAPGSPHEIGTLTIRNTFFYTSFFKRSEEKRSVSPSGGQGCFILLRESKKGGSSGAQQLFTSYFYKQTVPPERKYSLFDDLSKTLQSSRLFVAINEDIIALRRSRLKVNLQRMKQPCSGGGAGEGETLRERNARNMKKRIFPTPVAPPPTTGQTVLSKYLILNT